MSSDFTYESIRRNAFAPIEKCNRLRDTHCEPRLTLPQWRLARDHYYGRFPGAREDWTLRYLGDRRYRLRIIPGTEIPLTASAAWHVQYYQPKRSEWREVKNLNHQSELIDATINSIRHHAYGDPRA